MLGIALSGGGALGIAHIGVLKALEEHSIRPDIISGCSAGAIAGALYCSGKRSGDLLEFVKKAYTYKMLQLRFPTKGWVSLSYLRKMLVDTLDSDRFEDLEIPLLVAAVNLNTGQLEIFSNGALIDTVVASSSVPMMFQPVKIGDYQYVDGGMLNNFPVEPLIGMTDKIIGVNVIPNIEVPNKSISNLVGIGMRCFELSLEANTMHGRSYCDILIEPKKLHDYRMFQVYMYEEIAQIGYDATMEQMDEILKVVNSKTPQKIPHS